MKSFLKLLFSVCITAVTFAAVAIPPGDINPIPAYSLLGRTAGTQGGGQTFTVGSAGITFLGTPSFTNLNLYLTGDSVVGLGATQSITGAKTFDSSALKMKESGGGSDAITFAAPTISGAVTLTFPNATATFATLSLAESLSNKTLVAPVFSGITTSDGASVTTANAMGALAIDVTKWLNTKTIAADSTFTFSGTPATNTWFGVYVKNSDSASHVLTIPSSFSINRAASITSLTINGSAELFLLWRYDGSAYKLFGDMPATTGTGAYVLANSPMLVTPTLGVATATSLNGATITPTTGTLTLANGSTLATSGANPITLTSTGTTNVTLPTSGTLIGGPAGSDTQVQLNISGALGAVSGLTANTTTGAVTQTQTSLGTTTVPSFTAINTTVAAAGAQQVSPSFVWQGNGWKTDATAASQTVAFRAMVLPVQSSSAPSGTWKLQASVNGAAFSDVFTITNFGTTTASAALAGTTVSATAGSVTAAATSNLGLLNRSKIQSSADGLLELVNQAGSAFTRLNFGGSTSSFVALQSSGTTMTVGTADGGTSAGAFNVSGTLTSNGDFTVATAKKISIASGSNQRAGDATLVGGTVTVNNTSVTANTKVLLTRKTAGGTIGTAITYTVSAGNSFTITSDNVLDTSTFTYLLIEVP